jgi:hypothetical protein
MTKSFEKETPSKKNKRASRMRGRTGKWCVANVNIVAASTKHGSRSIVYVAAFHYRSIGYTINNVDFISADSTDKKE